MRASGVRSSWLTAASSSRWSFSWRSMRSAIPFMTSASARTSPRAWRTSNRLWSFPSPRSRATRVSSSSGQASRRAMRPGGRPQHHQRHRQREQDRPPAASAVGPGLHPHRSHLRARRAAPARCATPAHGRRTEAGEHAAARRRRARTAQPSFCASSEAQASRLAGSFHTRAGLRADQRLDAVPLRTRLGRSAEPIDARGDRRDHEGGDQDGDAEPDEQPPLQPRAAAPVHRSARTSGCGAARDGRAEPRATAPG